MSQALSPGKRLRGDASEAANGGEVQRLPPAPSRAAFLAALPKVELHAHINGSLPAETVLELLKEADPSLYEAAAGGGDGTGSIVLKSEALLAMPNPTERMARCFKVFDAVYRVMATADRMRPAMFAMLDAYRAENTAYLELRTTPRAGVLFPPSSSTAEGEREPRTGTDDDYVELVMKLLDEYDATHPGAMVVKLLLSINRRGSGDAAMRVVQMAAESRNASIAAGKDPRVVGIDLGGDCYAGKWETFAPAVAKAQAEGLKVTLHVGEKDDEPELRAMLAAGPDRIGHLVFAQPETIQSVRAAKVPLELCISSNLMTTNWTVREHHVGEWWAYAAKEEEEKEGDSASSRYDGAALLRAVPRLAHPISINTDDRGVFDTTLVRELELFLRAAVDRIDGEGSSDRAEVASFGDKPITPREALAAVAVTKQGLADAFASAAEREAVTRRLERFCGGDAVAALLRVALETCE